MHPTADTKDFMYIESLGAAVIPDVRWNWAQANQLLVGTSARLAASYYDTTG